MPVTKTSPSAYDAPTRRSIAFLNVAHGLDHFVLLIYPTVVIGLEVVYQRPYSELIALTSAPTRMRGGRAGASAAVSSPAGAACWRAWHNRVDSFGNPPWPMSRSSTLKGAVMPDAAR